MLGVAFLLWLILYSHFMMYFDVHSFRALTIEQLLGRDLNGVEKKYAPKTVYVSDLLSIPLRGLRVSVVGTRNPRHGERAAER
jgi:hypothetical protein